MHGGPSMRDKNPITATLVLSFSCALLSASCLQDSKATPEPDSNQVQSLNGSGSLGEARQEARGPLFTPGEFIFVVEREWDGEDRAGGWQIAYSTSGYETKVDGKVVYAWQCRMRIGMPRHSEKEGDIPTSRAAAMSAEIANDVTWPLLKRKEPWTGQGALFCAQQRAIMKKLFESRYPFVGATVERG